MKGLKLSKVMVVGEAWGEHEVRNKMPFTGYMGTFLCKELEKIGINDVFFTNVFNQHPDNNNLDFFCGHKNDRIPNMPTLGRGKYVRKEFEFELVRLYREIEEIIPNLILACGGTAAWALLKENMITKVRGTLHMFKRYKVLPTYHPSAIIRNFKLYPVFFMDLHKAKQEMQYANIKTCERVVHIAEDLCDLHEIESVIVNGRGTLSIDIETQLDQITCIGFAPSEKVAYVIPFHDKRRIDGNYWRTLEDELTAWDVVRRMANCGRPVVGQNFLYDMHFLWRKYGIAVPNADDTMLMHHAMQPELQKSLGFLASIYTNAGAWKHMRTATNKKED